MTETRQKIFDSNDFVISELKKIQILYELKRIIRYDHKRNHEEHTESDAEHIFGMHCLIDFFLPLEDNEKKLIRSVIRELTEATTIVNARTHYYQVITQIRKYDRQ